MRYAIPGDYAGGRGRQRDDAGPRLGVDQLRRRRSTPEEVEAALKGHPDVFDALVVGVPDERFGQHVAAVVVQARKGTKPTLAELDSFVRTEIAGYKGAAQPLVGRRGRLSPAGKPDYRWAKEQTEIRPPTRCTPSTREPKA